MQVKFLDNFNLFDEKENYSTVVENISKDAVFKGTNLWVLIFAIFVASLGLNINSTAVIIGAMLISPLMGPIMGVGLGLSINDLSLFRKSALNYAFATGIALATSTLYFAISPINEAHSEILARTTPNIYDVLIAFFGGLAGIVATSSKKKGNVIPGVAIATALMPPLCTAGYGLATFKFTFFFGAFYLYFINTVFIALATLLTVRFLRFPYKHFPNPDAEKRNKRIVWALTVITILPSIYFGYDIVQQEKFSSNVDRFVDAEAHFQNDYLLNKKIDPKTKNITLTFGGRKIDTNEIQALKGKLKDYNLSSAKLQILQGFAYLTQNTNENKTNDQVVALSHTLQEKETELEGTKKKLDSIHNFDAIGKQLYRELKVQYPELISSSIRPATVYSGSDSAKNITVAVLQFEKKVREKEETKMRLWLQTRLNKDTIYLIINTKR